MENYPYQSGRLPDAARDAGILIIYTNVSYLLSLKAGGRFTQKVPALRNLVAGNPMGEWPNDLQPKEDELVVTKQYSSTFFGTSLAATLTANGIDSLIITGLSTSGSVRATCVDCCFYGFIPVIAEQAAGDRHEGPHKANLFDMQAKYADVVSAQKALDWIYTMKANFRFWGDFN